MLFFWDFARGDEPAPKHKTGADPTYMIVYVDGRAVLADRDTGGGPNGRHMLPHEGWGELRAWYLPADGRPHKVEGEYRVSDLAGNVGPRFLIHEALVVEPEPSAAPAAGPAGPRCGDDPMAYVVDRQLRHVETVTDRYHAATADHAERQERAMSAAINEGRQNLGMVMEMFERQAERMAVRDQALFAELGATNRAALETAQRGIDAAERLASSRAKGAAEPVKSAEALLLEKGIEILPKVAAGAYGLYQAAGGIQGIMEKMGGLMGQVGGGAVGGRGAQVLGESLKTLADTYAAVAMAKLDAQRPNPPAALPAEPAAAA